MSKSTKKPGKKPATETLKKEDIIQAVVVCDSFNSIFAPLTYLKPTPLLPIVNTILLDYTLEFLAISGVQEVILFCVSHADLIKSHINSSKWSSAPMNIIILVSEGCRSLGDAMRDLDAKAIVRGNFILLSGDTVANVQLLPILEIHKKLEKQDKGAVMTLLYKEAAPGHRLRPPGDEVLLAINATSNRILFHQKIKQATKKITFPLEVFMDQPDVDVLFNLIDTQIAICSPAVPQLFSDNFDFQTRDDFVRGLLLNEEILASTMYCHRLQDAEYASRADNWHTYQSISHDIIHRWVAPFVPDTVLNEGSEPYMFLRQHVYRQKTAKLSKGCVLEEDVVIAEGSTVGENTNITRSVIGRNCLIGSNVTIRDSFIWDNVQVADGCRIANSVLTDDCSIATGVNLDKGCILCVGVTLTKPGDLSGMKLVRSPIGDDDTDFQFTRVENSAYSCDTKVDDVDDESDDERKEYVAPGLYLGTNTHESDYDVDVMSLSSGDLSDRDSPLPDDTNMFYNEVVDSLARGYEDKLACDNLILEINSSRYAYNVSVKEVNFHVVRALLNLPEGANNYLQRLAKQLIYFLPILMNYIKRNQDAQMDCLQAIEEVAEIRSELRDSVGKLLHLFYDKEILEEGSIMKWYNAPNTDLPSSTALRKQVSGFITWLEEADEETESEED